MSVQNLDGRPVIIGGGIAGLMTALHLAPQPVLLLSRAPLGADASSAWAQGGLAASLGDDDDPALHLADTLAAGDGLCDREMASRILNAAPGAIDRLAGFGVRFDRAPDGTFRLGLEAAHSRRRIVHAGGDGSGREVMRALVAAVRSTPTIEVVEGFEARRLAVEDGSIAGVLATCSTGPVFFATGRVVLATGGIGGLFLDSTNPLGSCGQGLALAARAGATLADLEFVQFHPTALDGSGRPMTLISEAVRGEGATIVDGSGRRLLQGVQGAELAPRDVLARAVWNHLANGHRVFLDVRERPGPAFARQFPTIASACGKAGIDPTRDLIPIRPAQHYHMGGIAVDGSGRTSVLGLWACGEVAATGLHGANRLASNSLTEAVVCARWVAESIAGTAALRTRQANASDCPPSDPEAVRPLLSRALGVVRDGEGLKAAARSLLPLAEHEGADPAAVGLMIAIAALLRRESRGAHYRTDFPHHATDGRRSEITLEAALAAARELAHSPALETVT
ncbi:L-aspartate oxidase [Mesorhizobium sp. M4B.F.Ca.ET.215.01.1.1]|uniref:L-aspartate oxidase n=1 Tax=unclassified Mesorhizobium TaxID=325217 RepID=UPI000FCC35DC|nr:MULTISPECIES: L-aspartate oxidase [unclassified Mesorhizobium]RUW24811.1 L-aspartate oxidase [Mesorhizobium sp. M4B.F.Ca.ET.013.02.1.1]RUW65774.1 L-aspartate oxidase [Mesorhizobium sp. M4B.F.Ca.ET.049.02.1.2]RVD38857.1 L-aspartate oxidase [Mesorhizobium sp. M4B.F.Ca.ET.019.03.1.1]RWF67837.1 MAG: L-aspartate oxidase [Mesorhizobium sp.]TGQ18534.1 L-aspartate oxidase [Mesorhizobium sp. M4B.F.Ca.ET.215.01.1.1]